MNYRKAQIISLHFCRHYSFLLERINRNPLNRKFLLENRNIAFFSDRESLWLHISQNFLSGEAIDYPEFGVFEGYSLRKWSEINNNSMSRFFGFDTFTGLPEKWFGDMNKDAFTTGGKIPEISDTRITFIKGLFTDTLDTFLKEYNRNNRMVINIDADLYSSTLFVLASLNRILANGDIIIFDDFLDPVGEFKAFLDYSHAFAKNFETNWIC
ncbi:MULTISPECIES: class I SAM-dependent methyltransferase [unclassified Acidiplasma]|uniref:class I SAM-dependent methyltransferase n=1 Tax=unclassified Acidiplasma TaxID=2641301 RepID=UPI000B09E58C|nr:MULTISPECIES: class I SAM-dependent methyltransferase [unclassified Acidiplasma]WMT55533.1 MAG: class I SAM-dependent methyltransferase [Acidiplasma sp.]